MSQVELPPQLNEPEKVISPPKDSWYGENDEVRTARNGGFRDTNICSNCSYRRAIVGLK